MLFDNIEDAFKQLDEAEYAPFANALASYRDALIKQGFKRKEAVRVASEYAKFIYEWVLEDALHQENRLIKLDVDDLDDIDEDTSTSG